MSLSLITSAPRTTQPSNSTKYGTLAAVTTEPYAESYQKITHREPGTMSNLKVKVIANTLNSGTVTYTFRKNTGDGNQTLSFGYGATGTFEDTSNTDSISAGDVLSVKSVSGGTSGFFAPYFVSCLFTPTTSGNTDVRSAFFCANYQLARNSTFYASLGHGSGTPPTTEAWGQTKIKNACTAKNLYANVGANSITPEASTITLAINSTGSSLTMSVPASTTGVYEDTSNSASISADDLVSIEIATGTGSSSQYMRITGPCGCDLISTSDMAHYTSRPHSGSGATFYWGIAGERYSITESNMTCALGYAGSATSICMYISWNGESGSSTFALRKGAASTALSASIGGSASGWFEDTDAGVSIASGDLICFMLSRSVGSGVTIKNTTVAILTGTPASGRVSATQANLTYTEKEGKVTATQADLTYTEKTGRVTATQADLTYLVYGGRVTATQADLTYSEKKGRVSATQADITYTYQGTLEQNAYRARYDDGGETAATWQAALNTPWTQNTGVIFRVRVLIKETTAGYRDNITLKLQYNLNAAGWNDVTGASSVVQAAPTVWIVDGSNTTQQLGGGSFITPNSGLDDIDGQAGGADLDFAGSDECEVEYAVRVIKADVSDSDTITLRCVESDDTPLTTYTNTPSMTVNMPIREDVDFKLQASHNSSAWFDVTGSSSVIKAVDSSYLADGGDTSPQLGSGVFLWDNDGIDEVDGVSGGLDFFNTTETELENVLQIIDEDVSDADTIELRMVENDGADTLLESYLQYPTITVSKVGGMVVMVLE